VRQRNFQIVYGAMIVCLVLCACWSEEDGISFGGADGICSELACRDMVSIEVSRRDEGVFPPGDYTFLVETDAADPLVENCILSEGGALSCGGEQDISIRLTAKLDTFVIRADDISPKQLLVSVSFESSEIGSKILKPDYHIIGGADPDCTQTCFQGTAEMRTAAFD
jgi:hypothetical protein